MASIKLTEIELKLLMLIPVTPRRISSIELVKLYYGKNVEFYGQQIIVGRVRGIIRKLKRTRQGDWMISKSERAGPKPIYYSRVRISRPVSKAA